MGGRGRASGKEKRERKRVVRHFAQSGLVVKVFKYATSNLAWLLEGDFVTLARKNKSCFSCIKFVGSLVKLLVYAATLLINGGVRGV